MVNSKIVHTSVEVGIGGKGVESHARANLGQAPVIGCIKVMLG